MKHQYESEILFHLMERDGFNIPSSVPPYESEIKAYLINQVKLAYPKLTDYEAEWLLYNYTKHLPADFPISSATNVTKATFENVVPFAYQSAILKGQTLVNIANKRLQYKEITVTNASTSTNYGLLLDGIEYEIPYPLIANKEYLIIEEWNIKSSNDISHTVQPKIIYEDGTVSYLTKGGKLTTLGVHKLVRKFIPVKNAKNFYFGITNNAGNTVSLTLNYAMIIEYQEGMENWGIPYFEDMKSVQMPVLKTVGKNLFDVSKATNGYVTSSGLFNNSDINNIKSDYIPIKPNATYSFIAINSKQANSNFSWFNADKTFISRDANTQISTSPSNASFLIVHNQYGDKDLQSFKGMLTESDIIPKEYEPYKANILSTSEEVELRGVGEVQDTLDCLTGEVSERIGEIVLDGSQPIFKLAYEKDDTAKCCIVRIKLDGVATGTEKGVYTNICCDKYKVVDTVEGEQNSESIKLFNQLDYVEIRLSILKTKLSSCNINAINSYLSSNPITVQYQLKEEFVKTVELKTVNESGESVHFMPLEGTMHVQLSGEPIQPTFDMSVPVEATTQNLASFIDLEMEE